MSDKIRASFYLAHLSEPDGSTLHAGHPNPGIRLKRIVSKGVGGPAKAERRASCLAGGNCSNCSKFVAPSAE